MGRPRQFNEPDAVAAASAVIAGHGFAGTSVDDLVRATGVNRASLYGVFGSKDGLFRRCLAGALDALDDANDVAELRAAAGSSAPAPDRRTALDLVLVALMELAPDDPALGAQVTSRLHAAGVTAADLGARALERATVADPA